ncbi:MAG: AAA family ATPase [Chloroflexota bacterium]
MISVCINCGEYHEDKIINMADSLAICPNCNYEHHIKMLPLYVITGASGTGKSTMCYHLMKRQTEYLALECDILWRNEFNQPDNDYYDYRNMWLRVAMNVQQGGKSVVLCGSSTPGSYEKVTFARYFVSIHYLALVCDDETLTARLKARPAFRQAGNDEFIANMLAYNQWYKDNSDTSDFDMTLLDTSNLSVDESIDHVLAWLRANN